MARRPASKPARRPAARPARKAAASSSAAGSARTAAAGSGSTAGSQREKIIAALLALLEDNTWVSIGLADVAAQAGVSLTELRGEFPSMLAILAAHMKATDRAVLAEDFSDMKDEPVRERLFDVLMRRLEMLAPHREAVRSLLRSARRNPPLALALNGLAVRSQQWMLTAAGISASGPRGMIRAQATAVIFASVLRTWIDDEDPGQARTMAALDRALGRGARIAGLIEDLSSIPSRLCRLRPRRRSRYADDIDDAGESAAA